MPDLSGNGATKTEACGENVSDTTGGPTFPIPETTVARIVANRGQNTEGMMLRDYFAAAALTGFILQPSADANPEHRTDSLSWERIAEIVYRAADAMLQERGKKA